MADYNSSYTGPQIDEGIATARAARNTSGILKGDGNGNVSAATAGTDYATPAQSLALGLTGASVGDLVRVNSVDSNGKPTSWKKVALNEIKCNKNLLDNWYFVGGGSQLGDGVFPINQRRQTTYSGAGYGIDRWTSQSAVQCTLNTDYITVKASQNYTNFTQIIKTDLSGEKLTLSILTTDGCFSISFIASSTDTFLPIHTSEYNVSMYLRASANNGETRVSLFAGGGANDNPVQINIIAVKLELGPEQTLCHNEGTEENPVWVLNEIPDYGDELRKCQRYFRRFKKYPSATSGYSTFGFGAIGSETNCNIVLPMQAQMMDNPAISYSGNFRLVIGNADKPVTGISWSPGADNGVMVNATFSGSSSDIGKMARLAANNDPNAYIDVSCEL